MQPPWHGVPVCPTLGHGLRERRNVPHPLLALWKQMRSGLFPFLFQPQKAAFVQGRRKPRL